MAKSTYLYRMKICAVGSKWGDLEKLPEFIETEKWVSGKPELAGYINLLELGDILVAKSSFTGGHPRRPITRVKAIGVVRFNPKNGESVDVDWVRFAAYDLPEMGAYRDTITEVKIAKHQQIFLGCDDRIIQVMKKLLGLR